jgi:3-oxoadipate enol-lactonase
MSVVPAVMRAPHVEAGGVTIYAIEAGRGRPLVFLHGLGWDHSLWRDAVERFSDRYRVIAGDTRGHGRSDKPAGPYMIATFAEDWHRTLSVLGVEAACLVGFSQGGMIAQLLAIEHPEQITALVLVSTSCRSDPAVREKLEERIRLARAEGATAAARLAAQSIFSKGFMAARPERIEEFVQWRAAMDQEPLFKATRAAYDLDLSERLKTVRIPTLVMYGDEDALTPPPVVRWVAECIPDAELVGVAGAGHMIPVEKRADFESLLARFLGKHYPATV